MLNGKNDNNNSFEKNNNKQKNLKFNWDAIERAFGNALIITLIAGSVGYSAFIVIDAPKRRERIAESYAREDSVYYDSAIVFENGNALIIDYHNYSKTNDKVELITQYGTINVDENSVILVEGNNSHERAEEMAKSLIDEDGKITCYKKSEEHNKVFVKTNNSNQEF